MAQSDRRSTPKDSVETDDAVTPEDGTVSETGSLSQEPAGDSDAPDDGPHPTADLGDADPRSSATAGAADDTADDADDDVDDTADDAADDAKPAAAVTAKTKAKKPKKATSDADAADEKPAKKGKASRSGDPARKGSAEEKKKPSSVSRTPVKPKRIANRWAAPMMLACAGIGLAWIVVFYVTQDRIDIPWYSDLGSWNLVVGMGFIVAAFGFSMKWE